MDSSLLRTSELNAALSFAPALIPYSFILHTAQEATLAEGTLCLANFPMCGL